MASEARDYWFMAYPMKYSIVTFGCRVNQADSLAIEAELCSRGAEAVSPDRADVVVVNTCSVTASADQGARQTIRRIARDNPAVKIIATGCYATRCANEVAELPGVIRVVGNNDKDPQTFVAALVDSSGHALQPLSSDGPCGRRWSPGLMGRTAWTLRVQTGCEEKCSYCIIPTTRGGSRSRTIEDVLNEVHQVIAAGYKEIAVTGVHLGSYGRDLSPRLTLATLLRVLTDIPGVLFRVSSLEPMDFPPEIVDRVAPHFHLPLQHASNRVLRLMRRPYTIEQYSRIVDDIRVRVPHAAIGTDVIVGFPGETDEDFQTLVRYLEASPVTHIHVFPYSDRPGTEASSLPHKVHGSIVRARGEGVREIARRLQERFRASLAGTRRPALTIEDGSVAITDNYVRVAAPPGHARNEWVQVVL
ncbi:MAG TPA: MiaB/RimO family radical SAM methylthiotransferase [Vicinamibacterales bacterium]|nr:MiaB/RimO family radical SAM methylthiotransferase [Vicinamibacterales bacterium]